MNTQVIFKIAIASAFILGLGLWIHFEYGWASTLAQWRGVPANLVVTGLTLTLASHFLRVARVYCSYLQLASLKFAPVLGVSLVHNTLSFLLPMRLGELALPLLSKRQLSINLPFATAALFLLRLFDLHVLLALLAVFAGKLWLNQSQLLLLALALVTSLPLGIILLRYGCKRIPKLQFVLPLVNKLRVCCLLYTLTCLLWSIKLFAFALLASLLGGLAIDHAWLATIIADASALSPITGFANAGTFEAAFALPLIPLGYEGGNLIQVAVNLHIFIFIVNVLAGIIGLMFLGKAQQTNQ